MELMKSENGKTYLNRESVPVNTIFFTGHNLEEIGKYLLDCGVRNGDQIYEDDGVRFLCAIDDSYRDADEENPKAGNIYVIFPNKKVVLYTGAEFEANFKLV